VLGEKLGAERIEITAAEMVIEYPKGQMSRDKLLEIASRAEGYPVEFAASGPVKIKLPLGIIKGGWDERLGYAVGFLGEIAGAEQSTMAQ
jgi:hypothetical protein